MGKTKTNTPTELYRGDYGADGEDGIGGEEDVLSRADEDEEGDGEADVQATEHAVDQALLGGGPDPEPVAGQEERLEAVPLGRFFPLRVKVQVDVCRDGLLDGERLHDEQCRAEGHDDERELALDEADDVDPLQVEDTKEAEGTYIRESYTPHRTGDVMLP